MGTSNTKLAATFIASIFKNHKVLFSLARVDFKKRYLDSYFGILWAFIQPVITILIFWFVFQVGFKAQPSQNVPFIIWLLPGIIPWYFFNDTLLAGASSIIEYNFLVKKMVFPVSLLPIIKLLATVRIHLFFIVISMLILALKGYYPTWYGLQLIYYLFALCVLLLGLSWLTASIMVFFRDLAQIIAISLQFGFWLTPIFWSSNMLPEKYEIFLKLNPMYYIVEGYRNSLLYKQWFWQDPAWTLYFWCIALCIFVLGAAFFTRLRPHFADVL
ncbi:MAG: tagG [Gammaproteobacteria bacterium]|jgi:lipopolysaccharide transport system permease protein/teichoic acid transport system permease protein|nr:tagG [Gammaproteobacteria bacterium]